MVSVQQKLEVMLFGEEQDKKKIFIAWKCLENIFTVRMESPALYIQGDCLLENGSWVLLCL